MIASSGDSAARQLEKAAVFAERQIWVCGAKPRGITDGDGAATGAEHVTLPSPSGHHIEPGDSGRRALEDGSPRPDAEGEQHTNTVTTQRRGSVSGDRWCDGCRASRDRWRQPRHSTPTRCGEQCGAGVSTGCVGGAAEEGECYSEAAAKGDRTLCDSPSPVEWRRDKTAEMYRAGCEHRP